MSQETLRLSKRMVELGLCSRREADELIEQGRVLVDGRAVDTLGSRVTPAQHIAILPATGVATPERVTLLLNKPAALRAWSDADLLGVTALLRPELRHGGPDIRFLKKHVQRHQVAVPLDPNASGLLVLTQDARLAQRLAQAQDFEQEFLVWPTGPVTTEQVATLARTRAVGEATIKPFKVTRQSERQLRFLLREHRPGLIPALCASVGLGVASYRRIRVGRLALGDLPEGGWRYLGPNERF
ncbi:RNA-binding protein S4 [Chitiniphilus shinanonensis]|uniref:Dual-specificity RNA pseudouridine synthase RluF n=1 Tax=Chitiniphilus shinanonensis TaxID=553088 RepID=A0ABQ6BS46_9NEIS|nr:RNA pseudouridine synthase [Chitiniphilus shinanonensis]GLS04156.1 RNA-binding protein S4 [Chitiniphilus shinanonensis]